MTECKKRLGRRLATVGFISLSTAAFAWGGDVSASREILRDSFAVRMANGSTARASAVFTVTATIQVIEGGNANWPDDRACRTENGRRVMTRSLNLTTSDGTVIPVRDTTIVLPGMGGRSWPAVTPCNDVIGQIQASLSQASGSASDWQSYIDGQRSEIKNMLSQFGQVT